MSSLASRPDVAVRDAHGNAIADVEDPSPDTRPIAQFPMDGVVTRYVPWAVKGTRLRGVELEPAVAQWLRDLSRGSAEVFETEPERSLAAVGFLDALRGGHVEEPRVDSRSPLQRTRNVRVVLKGGAIVHDAVARAV